MQSSQISVKGEYCGAGVIVYNLMLHKENHLNKTYFLTLS